LLSVVVAGFAAAQTTTPPTTAPGKTAPGKTASGKTTPNRFAAASAASPAAVPTQHGGHGQVREALHWAHRLLAEADHDYDGHRARAAHEVHKALEELGAHHAHATVPSTGTSTPSAASSVRHAAAAAPAGAGGTVAPQTAAPAGHVGAATPAMHESQARSDAQLRKAREILRMVSGELRARHPHAHLHVAEAIGEIDRALAIK
jgi:hypothetical protein